MKNDLRSDTGSTGRKKVLIVDDDAELGDLLARAWGKESDIVLASSGAEAIVKCRAEEPDAMVLDVLMPGLNGLDVVRLLQMDVETRHIPVFILTAAPHAGRWREVFEAEANVAGFMEKGGDLAELRKCAREEASA